MYKRGTHPKSPPHSEVVAGKLKMGTETISEDKNYDVMMDRNKVRCKWLTVRLSKEEEIKLNKFYKQTTCRDLSEYSRSILLKRPVYILYRNQSADDFLTEMIQLKKELNAIGNNFNQVVHKLHTLDNDSEVKAWAILNEVHKNLFLKKVSEVQEKLSQIHNLWLQK
jgi:Skp family chaperone for outer membrane proteins